MGEPPQVTLNEEEVKTWFLPARCPDLSPSVLNSAFGKFTLPSTDEGFDTVNYEWQDSAASREYLRTWVLERKLTTRIEDLQPSEWFRTKALAWQKLFAEWQAKQIEA